MRKVRNSHGDQRSRLQRRPHLFALASSVSVFLALTLGADSQRAAQARIWEEFSGEKALTHVQRLVDFGPRPPGSDAIEKSRDYIDNQLRLSGWRVTRQALTDDTPRGKVRFVNVIARFAAPGGPTPSFLFCFRRRTELAELFHQFCSRNDGRSHSAEQERNFNPRRDRLSLLLVAYRL